MTQSRLSYTLRVFMVMTLALGACGKDSEAPTHLDSSAPEQVTDLEARALTSSSIEVSWTAPGGDGGTGTAAQYDLRYSTSQSTAWANMTPVVGTSPPLSAGTSEDFTVTDLTPETAYYFRLATSDDVPNWSDVSNTASASTLCLGDEHWDFATMRSGHRLHAGTEWSGNLVMGGLYDTSGPGIVEQWNGASWETLGVFRTASGFGPEYIRSVAVYNGELVAAGSFERADATSANNIAVYDGSSWSALGSGLTYEFSADNEPVVLALIVFEGQLVVGGWDFSHAGGVPVQGVTRWTGSAWEAMGSLPAVSALAVHNGSLFAGTGSGIGSDLKNVHRWNGTSWDAVGTGMDGSVLALLSDGTSLIAGGTFGQIGGVTAHLARWNGSSWSALGSGDWNDDAGIAGVRAIMMYGGDLIVGGSFKLAGGAAANGIARWDGVDWQRMGCPPRPPALGTNFDVNYLGGFEEAVVAGYYDGAARWRE